MDCIFCKIAKKEIPKDFLYESTSIIAFLDINPSADLHILIVPKQHIGSVLEIGREKGGLLTEVYEVVKKLVEDNSLQDNSYRIVVNGGKARHVPHLHFHLLGGQWKKPV